MADELRQGLADAGIGPPFVLVGHSIGGIIARRFAVRYRGDVAGMVLIDSSHEDQARRRRADGWWRGAPRTFWYALRRRARILGLRRLVRLAGGPHDGGRDFASPGEILMYEADAPSSDPPGYVPLLAWYVPSQYDSNVYVFAGAERDPRRQTDPAGQRPGSAGRPKPRVYELAAEFNVESKAVMDQLKQMGEFVGSASSIVEHPVAQKLREQFYAQAHRKSGSPG